MGEEHTLTACFSQGYTQNHIDAYAYGQPQIVHVYMSEACISDQTLILYTSHAKTFQS